ncbi:MAG: amino acid adenylation domain-containing protein, partial [Vicinamibacterales bacterium]
MSRVSGATRVKTLAAAFTTLLHRHADQDDVVIGTPTAGRNRSEIESLVGFFINTVVLRTDVSGNPTFVELIDRVKRATLDGFTHQDVPFDRLVEELRPERDPSRNPLFQVAFALQNASQDLLQLPGVEVRGEPQPGDMTRFDLELHLVEGAAGLYGLCSYNTDLFDASTIERLLDHYRVLLEAIVANPRRRVDEMPLMTPAERQDVLGRAAATNTVPRSFTPVHERFAAVARQTPAAIAVSCAGRHLSYRELDERANQLAGYLAAQGVGGGDLVGLCIDRSLDMVVAILGILKAGCAYVPLDPAYPADRLAYMLEDSAVRVVVSAERTLEHTPVVAGSAICWVRLDRDADAIASMPVANPGAVVAEDSFAYVIYTSGSTGHPKGVTVTHRNVSRLFTETDAWFGFTPDDVWTLFHSYAFDFSVWEIWGALLYGGRLVVVPYEVSRSPAAFHELIRRERVTVLNQTPSAFRQLIDADAALGDTRTLLALRWVVFGGEALDPQTLQPWFARHGDEQPRLVNMYGITETTVHVTIRLLSSADGTTSRSLIGRAIPDLELHVLDRHSAPAPVGVPGELFVGGPGVAPGYLNRAALTAARFVPNPYSTTPGARLYRTGDLARRLANGDLEYVGRCDQQVKIRGFRIELGEIESVLTAHPAVREAVVTRREDHAGDARLVAYLVPDARIAAPVANVLRLEREGLPEGIRSYELPNGLVVFHRNKNETDFLYREIFGDVSYLRHGIVLPPRACVFDVGANTGLFTVFVRSTCPDASVFAFEPIPSVCDVLKLNARIHGDARVQVFDCGLSDRADVAEFTYYPHLSIMSGRFADAASERDVIKAFLGTQPTSDEGPLADTVDAMLLDRLTPERVTCRLRTVSDIIREQAVERIDLLKVDVEKSELEVLLGVADEDWPKIGQVVVEVHDADGRLARVEQLLRARGFSVAVEQDTALEGTGLFNVYARRAVAAPAAAAPTRVWWQSAREIVDDARASARRSLPDYMVPAAFVVLDTLPMTPSGKVDRQALPAPERRSESDRGAVAPATDMEAAVARIWQEALDVERVGIHDNFFDLGGHSLLLARVHERLNDRLGLELSIMDLFRHPTVHALAAQAERVARGGAPAAAAVADR